jgi:glutathione S-transferase
MQKLTLIIGNKNYSSWSLRPWIFMKTAGIAFEEKRIPLYTDQTPELLKPYFSNAKVPVLIDGSLIVWDSLAILEYLAGKYPDTGGWPKDGNARAVARSVSAEMHSSFATLRSGLPMNCRKIFQNFIISAEVQHDINRIRSIWKYCKSLYGQNGPWLFGNFCIADAMFAPVVLRFNGYGIPLDGMEKEYLLTTLGNAHLIQWIEDAQKEKEIIEMCEVHDKVQDKG